MAKRTKQAKLPRKLSQRVEASIDDGLTELAQQHNRPKSAIVRDALAQYLKNVKDLSNQAA